MPDLNQNTMPAERAVGCRFADNFRSYADVIKNGGVVSGNPIIDDGVILNGTTDYITYTLDGSEFNSDEISIVIEFWPDFEVGDDLAAYLLDTTDGARYLITKNNNSANNTLQIYMGGTGVANIASSIFAPFWRKNERNILEVYSAATDVNVDLNGNNILSHASVAWSPGRVSTMILGARFNGVLRFPGKIGQVKIFQSLLTEQDAINFYNNATYDYINDSVVNLQMRAEDHDPTNTRTLDVSGNDNHATIVSATKTQKRGYEMDGVDDALTGLPSLTGDFTVVILSDNEVNFYNTDTVYETIKTAGGFTGHLQELFVTSYILTPLQEADEAIRLLNSIQQT